MNARELETKTRGAGGAYGLRLDASGHVTEFRVRDEDRELRVSAPLGVETGEAWNAPLGDTWSRTVARFGSIGGTVLA